MLHSVDVAKTHEIMARFRPIAPKPAMPPQTPLHDVPSGLHQHQHQHQHQPCAMSAAAVAALQLRVRGAAPGSAGPGLVPLPMAKRQKPFYPLLPSTTTDAVATATLAAHRHPPLVPNGTQTAARLAKSSGDHLTLSLLPCSPPPPPSRRRSSTTCRSSKTSSRSCRSRSDYADARAARGLEHHCRAHHPRCHRSPPGPIPAKPEVVEEEVESETLPAVVSDSRNRVRLANSAYKEMVASRSARGSTR
uniref:Uncharacterized protein n=1 Tax=Ananas comosus var. bracteatus TaxID=296719 RepID=A0A6V7PPJ6_ANACO|nr:unnamed protein product [Ananas comosus var. bracteatus]